MRGVFSVLGILALGPGCACGNDGPNPTEGEVTLGTGTVDFVPLVDGDELEVVAGPQGGFHFHVHARMRGLAPGDPSMPGLLENPSTTFSAFLESTGEQLDFAFPPYRLGYVDVGGGQFELPSGRILQIREESIPAVYGQRVKLTLEISDGAGRDATTELTITAVQPIGGGGDPDAGVDASGSGS